MNRNIPNILTILRVVLVPVFFVFFYWNKYAALAIFIIASLTDFLDGYLARKNNLVTSFGKFMDPLADKLLVTTALLCFADIGQIPMAVVVVVVGRDLAVDGLRMTAATKNVVMAAGWTGKVKTFATMVAICVMIVFSDIEYLNIIGSILILVLNVVSFVDYFWHNGKILAGED